MSPSSEIYQEGCWICASIADARSPVCGGGGYGPLSGRRVARPARELAMVVSTCGIGKNG